MTWPWLVVALLCYTLIGAVTAVAAYPWVSSNLITLGARDWGLRTVWAWACCLTLCLLAGLVWPLAVGAYAIRQRAASDGTVA